MEFYDINYKNKGLTTVYNQPMIAEMVLNDFNKCSNDLRNLKKEILKSQEEQEEKITAQEFKSNELV